MGQKCRPPHTRRKGVFNNNKNFVNNVSEIFPIPSLCYSLDVNSNVVLQCHSTSKEFIRWAIYDKRNSGLATLNMKIFQFVLKAPFLTVGCLWCGHLLDGSLATVHSIRSPKYVLAIVGLLTTDGCKTHSRFLRELMQQFDWYCSRLWVLHRKEDNVV